MENIIYGIRPVIEAIREGKNIEKILVQANLNTENFKQLKEELHKSSSQIKLQYVPIEKLNSLSKNKTHQGVVALCSLLDYSNLEDILIKITEQKKLPLLLFLDHITDVRNIGAISRSAECAGVDCIIVPNEGSAQINMDAMKTSAGALLKIPICKSFNTKTTINLIKSFGISIICATEKATEIYTKTNLNQPLCLVMGSESKGISKDILKMADNLVKIPMYGSIESLNVSVATGILIYEVIRQRTL